MLVMPDEQVNGGIGITVEDAFMPYEKGKDIMCPEVTGSSLRNCQAPLELSLRKRLSNSNQPQMGTETKSRSGAQKSEMPSHPWML